MEHGGQGDGSEQHQPGQTGHGRYRSRHSKGPGHQKDRRPKRTRQRPEKEHGSWKRSWRNLKSRWTCPLKSKRLEDVDKVLADFARTREELDRLAQSLNLPELKLVVDPKNDQTIQDLKKETDRINRQSGNRLRSGKGLERHRPGQGKA